MLSSTISFKLRLAGEDGPDAMVLSQSQRLTVTAAMRPRSSERARGATEKCQGKKTRVSLPCFAV